jgi:hypothetical protein
MTLSTLLHSRLRFALVVLLFVGSAAGAASKAVDSTRAPFQVILNPTTTPATSVALTWRTEGPAPDQAAQFAAATPGTSFITQTITVPARSETALLDTRAEGYYHSAVLSGLKPATRYLYRVGSEAGWTEWNQVLTAQTVPAPFSFVYFGDPQDGLKEHVTRIFRTADLLAPDAAFWLIAGDLTSEPEDAQIRDFFTAGAAAFRNRLVVPVAGNHDIAFLYDEAGKIVLNKKGKKQRGEELPPTWRAQFTLPENGVTGLEESNYHLDYQGVRLIVMNSNVRLADQAAWLEPRLASNPNRWTIVCFHHPLYSAGRDRDDRTTRDAFLPLFDRYRVDLVLTGHDHAYARSRPLRGSVAVPAGEHGTVYVVSSCGSKFYPVTPANPDLMAKTAGDLQLCQKISIDGDRLRYVSVAADGSVHDQFELQKK